MFTLDEQQHYLNNLQRAVNRYKSVAPSQDNMLDIISILRRGIEGHNGIVEFVEEMSPLHQGYVQHHIVPRITALMDKDHYDEFIQHLDELLKDMHDFVNMDI